MSTKKKVLLLPFDDEQEVRVVEVRDGNLEDIYSRIAPESRLFSCLNGKDFSLYGDDEALFHPQAHLRINARAMQLFADSAGADIEDFTSPLVGDFLVFGLSDEEGNSTEPPQRVLDFKFSWVTERPTS